MDGRAPSFAASAGDALPPFEPGVTFETRERSANHVSRETMSTDQPTRFHVKHLAPSALARVAQSQHSQARR